MTYLRHHWSAWTGDWYYGICDKCDWSGREVRTMETAYKWMNNHNSKCKGKKIHAQNHR